MIVVHVKAKSFPFTPCPGFGEHDVLETILATLARIRLNASRIGLDDEYPAVVSGKQRKIDCTRAAGGKRVTGRTNLDYRFTSFYQHIRILIAPHPLPDTVFQAKWKSSEKSVRRSH